MVPVGGSLSHVLVHRLGMCFRFCFEVLTPIFFNTCLSRNWCSFITLPWFRMLKTRFVYCVWMMFNIFLLTCGANSYCNVSSTCKEQHISEIFLDMAINPCVRFQSRLLSALIILLTVFKSCC